MPVGALLQADVGARRMPLAIPRLMEPRDAAAIALCKYLEAAVWTVRAKDSTKQTKFKLNYCNPEWPNEDDEINYPCAAVTVIAEERDAHNFVPTIIEDSWNKYAANSVLWKTSERDILFQVDFWVTNKPERQAIAAGLDEYFCPTEIRYGAMIEGPSEYWSQPVRFVLDSARGTERLDNSAMVFGRDRRLLARIRASIDDLQLHVAMPLDPRISMSVDDAPPEIVFPRSTEPRP